MAAVTPGLRLLSRSEALVGIPESNSPRRRGKVTNAELLFIHSNGSPLRNIPKRMVIEPAVEADPTKGAIAKLLGKAATAALDGDHQRVVDSLDLAGSLGESASKAWFTNPANGWPPNTPATLKSKLRTLSTAKRVAAIQGAEAGFEDDVNTVLVLSGQMRRAITHVTVVDSTVVEGEK